MSSSMAELLPPCRNRLGYRCRRAVALPGSIVRIGWCYSGVVSVRARLPGQFDRALAGFKTSHFLGRPGDPAERVAEIGKVDQRKQQAGYPEDVHVREEGNETQDGDNFKLVLVGLVRHTLGHGVQAKKDNSESQNGEQQKYGRNDHEHVRFARSGDERWHVVRRSRMSRVSHDHNSYRTLLRRERRASTLGPRTSEEKKLLSILLTSIWE